MGCTPPMWLPLARAGGYEGGVSVQSVRPKLAAVLQARLRRLEGERKEKEAADREREAETVRLKLVVVEAEKVIRPAAPLDDVHQALLWQ